MEVGLRNLTIALYGKCKTQVDRLTGHQVDKSPGLQVDRLQVDRLQVDRLQVDRLQVDRLQVDRFTG